MIDRATVDRIMEAADIVDVVSEFVSLRKGGASYKGLCPFHDDRTPSFSVSPSRGIYKCFSCGKAGNAVNFIMEHEQLTYVEALKWLAKKYHIEVKERELTKEEQERENERESIFIVNEWAAGFFCDVLHDDPDGQAVGMAYFRSRGFRDDVIAKFRLGFAPSRRDTLVTAARKKGYNDEYLAKSGLCIRRDDGSLYDRFAGRVIFPWVGVGGKVTAFGGRLLDARTKGVAQKYVNSPDSVVYHKDHELYGIYQAKQAISKEDCVYMVEGYTDVIAMHQCGIENVVANSGTALSVFQIKLLRRFTSNIVLLYDGDEAGIHAAIRGTDMLLAEGMNIKVLILPDNDDPDSFARKHTAAEFKAYIAEYQTDFMEFKTRLLLHNVSDPIKRSEAISSIVKSISLIKDSILRATYIKECATRVGMAEQTLISQMNKFILQDRNKRDSVMPQQGENTALPTPRVAAPPSAAQQTAAIEDLIIQMVIRHGAEVAFRDVDTGDGHTCDITVAEFIYYNLGDDGLTLSNAIYQGMLEEAVALIQEGKTDLMDYFQKHHDIHVSQVAFRLGIDTYQLSENNQVRTGEETLRSQVEHLLLDYRLAILKGRIDSLSTQLVQTTDNEQRNKLLADMMQLMEMRLQISRLTGKSIIL